MDKMDYVIANIYFGLSEKFENKVIGDRAEFYMHGLNISANLKIPYYIVGGINPESLDEFIGVVEKDLVDMSDCLDIYKQLVAQKKAHDILHYEKNTDGDKPFFRVYDLSSTPPGPVFPTMLAIKNIETRFLNPGLFKYQVMVKDVTMSREGDRGAVYIESANLRTAFQKAIEIYEQADVIRHIR